MKSHDKTITWSTKIHFVLFLLFITYKQDLGINSFIGEIDFQHWDAFVTETVSGCDTVCIFSQFFLDFSEMFNFTIYQIFLNNKQLC